MSDQKTGRNHLETAEHGSSMGVAAKAMTVLTITMRRNEVKGEEGRRVLAGRTRPKADNDLHHGQVPNQDDQEADRVDNH